MKTLWTFGDSQTFGFGCRPDSPKNEYYFQYKKEGDDIWPVLLSNKLSCELKNYGWSGYSNDKIFDSILGVYHQIKEGDYVVIGETFHSRFDVEDYRTNELISILGELSPDQFDQGWEKWINDICRTEEELMTLLNFSLYFSKSELLKERYHRRFEFIGSILPKNTKFLLWGWDSEINKRAERIYQHTKDKIRDGHFSFKGHRDFTQYAYRLLSQGITFL